MPEEPYKNRELDEKFNNLEGYLVRIEEQTKKTNGSVAMAQKDIAQLKLWRAYITGGMVVLIFLLASIAIPLIGSFIQGGYVLASSNQTQGK